MCMSVWVWAKQRCGCGTCVTVSVGSDMQTSASSTGGAEIKKIVSRVGRVRGDFLLMHTSPAGRAGGAPMILSAPVLAVRSCPVWWLHQTRL